MKALTLLVAATFLSVSPRVEAGDGQEEPAVIEANLSLAELPPRADLRLRGGAYAPYFTQPGVRLSLDLRAECGCHPPGAGNARGWFLSPRLDLHGRPSDHVSAMLGAATGYQFPGRRARIYSALSFGLDYLASAQVTTVSVNLGDGSLDRDREWRHALVATSSYRFGRAVPGWLGWYIEFEFGRKFVFDLDDSAFFSIGVGVDIPLRRPRVRLDQ